MPSPELPTISAEREEEFLAAVLVRQIEETLKLSGHLTRMSDRLLKEIATGAEPAPESVGGLVESIDRLQSLFGGEAEGDLWLEVASAFADEEESLDTEHVGAARLSSSASGDGGNERRTSKPPATSSGGSVKARHPKQTAPDSSDTRLEWPSTVKTHGLELHERQPLLAQAREAARVQAAKELHGFRRRKEGELRLIADTKARFGPGGMSGLFQATIDEQVARLEREQERFDSGAVENGSFERELNRLCREAAKSKPKKRKNTQKTSAPRVISSQPGRSSKGTTSTLRPVAPGKRLSLEQLADKLDRERGFTMNKKYARWDRVLRGGKRSRASLLTGR